MIYVFCMQYILLLESACPIFGSLVTKFATHQFLPPPDHYPVVVVVVPKVSKISKNLKM